MDLSALPVALAVGDPDGPVTRHVEGTLGWQSVDPAGSTLVRPALALWDGVAVVPPGLPTILLVADDLPAVRAAEAGRTADAVLAWPTQRDRLPAVASALVGAGRAAEPSAAPVLRVGAAAGGVGATTVALALAGLTAWEGDVGVLAVVRGHAPVPGVPTVTGAALAGPSVWESAAPVPGTQRLRTLVVTDGLPAGLAVADAERVVAEVGREQEADVLVLRPDAAGLAALATSSAGTVVVVGDGPVGDGHLEMTAGGRRVVRVAWSARVARASLASRVPAGLPGRWLADLRATLG